MTRRVLPVLTVAVAVILSGCVPSESSGLRQVDDGSDSAVSEREVPTFPADGPVPAALVVDGLSHDFTAKPVDQAYWAPLSDEARCAAEQIVTTLGADRIVGLGYRPGTPGASLNQLDLDDTERQQVVEAFTACVDMVEGLASIVYGAGRVPARVATCLARGMGETGAVPLIEAWAGGNAVDPFAEESEFATTLLSHAAVCIPDGAFNWSHVHLPESESLIDSDIAAGNSRSAFAGDAIDRDAPDPDAAEPGS
jgi:hypothetical protein